MPLRQHGAGQPRKSRRLPAPPVIFHGDRQADVPEVLQPEAPPPAAPATGALNQSYAMRNPAMPSRSPQMTDSSDPADQLETDAYNRMRMQKAKSVDFWSRHPYLRRVADAHREMMRMQPTGATQWEAERGRESSALASAYTAYGLRAPQGGFYGRSSMETPLHNQLAEQRAYDLDMARREKLAQSRRDFLKSRGIDESRIPMELHEKILYEDDLRPEWLKIIPYSIPEVLERNGRRFMFEPTPPEFQGEFGAAMPPGYKEVKPGLDAPWKYTEMGDTGMVGFTGPGGHTGVRQKHAPRAPGQMSPWDRLLYTDQARYIRELQETQAARSQERLKLQSDRDEAYAQIFALEARFDSVEPGWRDNDNLRAELADFEAEAWMKYQVAKVKVESADKALRALDDFEIMPWPTYPGTQPGQLPQPNPYQPGGPGQIGAAPPGAVGMNARSDKPWAVPEYAAFAQQHYQYLRDWKQTFWTVFDEVTRRARLSPAQTLEMTYRALDAAGIYAPADEDVTDEGAQDTGVDDTGGEP